MAQLSDIRKILQNLAEEHPHYLVGALMGKSEARVDKWIVAVKDAQGEILLKLTEGEDLDRSRALTVERLQQAVLALPSNNNAPVELCLCESDLMRVDSPIAGVYLDYDEETLVFMDWDQSRRRGLCEKSLVICGRCGQEKEGASRFCLTCQAEFAERLRAAAAESPEYKIETPDAGLPQAVVPFDLQQAREYQRMTAELLGLPVDEVIDLGQGLVLKLKLIPAGAFYRFGEFDFRCVRLTRPFYLGIYPVTQAQYQAVMGKNPSEEKGPDLPVETVPLDDVERFCAKLSEQLGRRFSLPTQAQWEYACRAGTTSVYCSGDYEEDFSDYGWYHDNSDGEMHPVGQRRANAFGLYDMHGNVNEWCQDYEDSLADDSSGLAIDPVGRTGSRRVFFGGSLLFGASECGSASSYTAVPECTRCDVGFRVALAVPVQK